jgi:hypothetical protein
VVALPVNWTGRDYGKYVSQSRQNPVVRKFAHIFEYRRVSWP